MYLIYLKKALSVLLSFVVVFTQPLSVVVADELPPDTTQTQEVVISPLADPQPETSTPTPAPSTVDNSANATDTVESTATTGDNTLATPTPTPTPADQQEPEESPTVQTADTLPLEDATQQATDSAVQTGDAIAITAVENSVNTASVNSSVQNQTYNSQGAQTGDIQVTVDAPPPPDAPSAQTESSASGQTVAQIENSAVIQNIITSLADTGNNTVENASSASILTGDAYSVVMVTNNVSTTLIDSVVNIFTINIFGDMSGNILLPDGAISQSTCCEGSVGIGNNASVDNTVTALTNTGGNSSTSSGSAEIITGNAISVVNIANIINATLLNTTTHYLFINIFGTWNGNFLGWDTLGEATGGASLVFQSLSSSADNPNGCDTCYQTVMVQNNATVSNVITSTANTGGNTLSADTASITSGNAFSAVSIVNLINTTLIRSVGYFGFINVFGTLTGDIGGEDRFAASTPPDPDSTPTDTTDQGHSDDSDDSENGGPRESGGQLTVTQSNNVGEYVLPGDTVTFFVDIGNPGSGRVYDTELYIGLLKDGVDLGGVQYHLGTVKPFGTLRVSTGLVLSNIAQPGIYTARAVVTGHVGPNNDSVRAFSDSLVSIAGFLASIPQALVPPTHAAQQGDTLGAASVLSRTAIEDILKKLLLLLALTSLTIQSVRKRRDITWAFYRLRMMLF